MLDKDYVLRIACVSAALIACTTMGEPPYSESRITTLSSQAAVDCIVRSLNQAEYLVLDANRDASFIRGQRQWRGGQFGVRDFVDHATFTVFTDAEGQTVVKLALATTVDNKPDEPSERGIKEAVAVLGSCAAPG